MDEPKATVRIYDADSNCVVLTFDEQGAALELFEWFAERGKAPEELPSSKFTVELSGGPFSFHSYGRGE